MDEIIESWKERIVPCFLEYPFGQNREIYDEEGRLHSDTEPALVTDTTATWYCHGLKHGLHLTKGGKVEYFFRGIKIPSHINPKFLNSKTIYGIMEGLVV